MKYKWNYDMFQDVSLDGNDGTYYSLIRKSDGWKAVYHNFNHQHKFKYDKFSQQKTEIKTRKKALKWCVKHWIKNKDE